MQNADGSDHSTEKSLKMIDSKFQDGSYSRLQMTEENEDRDETKHEEDQKVTSEEVTSKKFPDVCHCHTRVILSQYVYFVTESQPRKDS